MNELHLFAGAGGGILAGILLGHRPVCAVEIEPYPRNILLQRQRDGVLPRFPIWDDIRTFDGKPWKGRVDVVCGGFPCTDISSAGKGAGITGKQSGLWGEMSRVIHEVGSRYVFVENSPMLTSRGLGTVLGDLAEMGYDARWCVLGADDLGAPHRRKRIWILATNANRELLREQPDSECRGNCSPIASDNGNKEHLANPNLGRREIVRQSEHEGEQGTCGSQSDGRSEEGRGKGSAGLRNGTRGDEEKHICKTQYWEVEPDVGRVVDGMAHRVDRLKATGNGQVPAVAAAAFKLLMNPELTHGIASNDLL